MPFTGRAIYGTGAFSGVREDVSEQISMISPFNTPLLDRLAQAENAAKNVYHEWLEEELSPNTIVSSTAGSTTGTGLGVHVNGIGAGGWIMPGAILMVQSTGEYLQVATTAANTITVTRGFGGTTAGDIPIGTALSVIADAAQEGADVGNDLTRPRTRLGNYCQIFKKDIIVSGTMEAVSQHGDIDSEYAHQKAMRLRELTRDLEKAVIQGKSSGNTLGSASATRTFKGIWDSLVTNSTSTGTMTPDVVDNVIQSAWNNGATDVDLIVVDAVWKRLIDQFNQSRTQVVQGQALDEKFKNRVTQYESAFGTLDVMLNRWMRPKTMLVISSGRIKVVPLQGREFAHVEVARTGDSKRGMFVGEYTVEVKNEAGHAKAYG